MNCFVFPDGTSCNTFDFYQGRCGQEWIRDIKPRKECEAVFIAFEECEEGLIPSKQKYLLEQLHCKRK